MELAKWLSWFGCVLVLATGCYGAHAPGAEGGDVDGGTGIPDDPPPPDRTHPTPPPPPDDPLPPAPPAEGIPDLVRGTLTDECGLRDGTTRFVLVPDGEPRFADLCEDEPDTYLEIETNLLPENGGELRMGGDRRLDATLCSPAGCVSATDGSFEIFVARGEVATVGYDVRFEDGTSLTGWAEISSFCGEWCARPMDHLGVATLGCRDDDGPSFTVTMGTEAPACGAPLVDGTSVTVFADPASLGWADYFRIPEEATGKICTEGRCTEALEGIVRIDSITPGEWVSGEYVFFASPGTDFSGRFYVSEWCESFAACG
jgi:hypothetical protein